MILDDIKSNCKNTCLHCGDPITLDNWSGWEAFTSDGKSTQPICKFCNFLMDCEGEKEER